MKDVFQALRTAYHQQLDGLAVGAEAIQCYDDVAPDNTTPSKYIILSTQTGSEEGNKHANITDCTMLVDVVVKSTSSTGKLECDEIADQIMQQIDETLTLTGFDLITCQLVSSESLFMKTGTGYIYRRLIRYRHSVVETS